MASILLQGPPGSGKTTMACLTAVNKPVHVIDVDRKIPAMENIRSAVERGEVTFWEVDTPLVEETLAVRVGRLSRNEPPAKEPRGWKRFAELVDALDQKEEAKRAGTWVVDSATRLSDHMARMILFLDKHGASTFSQRDWGSHLTLWAETLTILIDSAREQGKDLIVTVHERVAEVPTANTKIVKSQAKEGIQRDYLGVLDLKVAASIGGQFGIQIGSYFEEVYGLRVEVDREGKPIWLCRVLPDGKRDLRTSFKVDKPEFPPDFTQIWKKGA